MVPMAINTAIGTTERNTDMLNPNYDESCAQWFDYCIEGFIDAGGNLDEIDDYTFSAWFDLDQEEEALARARAIFDRRVEHARRATFIKRLEESAHGLEIPYADIYMA